MTRAQEAAQGRRRWPLRALSVLALIAVTGCTPLYRDHGYTPSDEDLAKIRVGVDTRDSVAEAVGTPTSSGVLRDSGYYYVSQRVRSYAFFEPEIVDREVVAISFDGNGVVRNVERYGLQDGKPVALSRRVTDSSVEGLSFIQQLLGSVRNFDVGNFLNQ